MRVLASILLLVLVIPPAVLAAVTCDDPAATMAARTAVDSACPCATAGSPRAYAACAKGVLDGLVSGGSLSAECAKAVRRCLRKSACGRPGRATCCTPGRDGFRCKVTEPARCLARGGCVGTQPSCCDACGSTGCVTTTTSTTSTTVPPSSCGNGTIEPGERCDGEPFCVDCALPVYACCDLATEAGVCSRYFMPEPGPPFCLESGATTHLGTVAPGGPTCAGAPPGYGAGACGDVVTFAPTTFCCQKVPCTQVTLSDTASLVSWLLLSCEQPFGFHPAVVGTCGPDFQCHPG